MRRPWTGCSVLLPLGMLALLSAAMPAARTAAAELVEVPAWRAPFDSAGVTGAIVLYEPGREPGAGRYRTSDPTRAQTGFRPGSTFKIFSALAALEAGVVSGPDEMVKWDGKDRCLTVWNRDHSLRTAYQASAFWVYQQFARRIGTKKMRHWMNEAHYGNRATDGGVERYWLDGDLRTSLVDQVDFLRRLHGGTLPFSRRVVDAVLDVMVEEKGEGYVLRGKTGWARTLAKSGDRFVECRPGERREGGPAVDPEIGWYVGYVERGERVVFFAINVDIRKTEDAAARRGIVKRVLQEEGVLAPSPAGGG